MDSVTLLCNECGKCFKEEASLLVHYSRTHDKRCFTCGKCGDEIIGKQNHLNHTRKHKNAIPKLKKVLKCDDALTKHQQNQKNCCSCKCRFCSNFHYTKQSSLYPLSHQSGLTLILHNLKNMFQILLCKFGHLLNLCSSHQSAKVSIFF